MQRSEDQSCEDIGYDEGADGAGALRLGYQDSVVAAREPFGCSILSIKSQLASASSLLLVLRPPKYLLCLFSRPKRLIA